MVFQSARITFEQDEVRNSRGIDILFSGGEKGITFSGLQNCRFENIGKLPKILLENFSISIQVFLKKRQLTVLKTIGHRLATAKLSSSP